jgi:hypothetical protein
LAEQRAIAIDQWFLLQGNQEVRRIASQCFAEKPRRRDADGRERMSFDDECRTDD